MGAALPVVTTGLAIAQVGIGVANSIAQANAAQVQKDATVSAAEKQTAATYGEIDRQQIEVNRIAAEQVSDRVRAADAELASAQVAAGERGVSGTTMGAMVRSISYLEGADMSRIRSNADANIAAGEASKTSAKNGYLETVNIANNQQSVTNTSAFLGAVGSGLSIAGNYFNQSQQLNAAQNLRTG